MLHSIREEASVLAGAIAEIRAEAGPHFIPKVVTHLHVDNDAVIAAALLLIACPNAELILQSANKPVSAEQRFSVGVDIAAGERSIKGRSSSAAQIAAVALGSLGFQLDNVAIRIVAEATAVDQGNARALRTTFTISKIIGFLRSAKYSDAEIVQYVTRKLRSHVREPEPGVQH
jgi:hypothetical protein